MKCNVCDGNMTVTKKPNGSGIARCDAGCGNFQTLSRTAMAKFEGAPPAPPSPPTNDPPPAPPKKNRRGFNDAIDAFVNGDVDE